MKLTVLTDNNVLQSKNFLGEHGLSFYLELDDKKILFDTGCSDVFLKNAPEMGINLLDLDYIVLSHGHYDHCWGLTHYLPFYLAALKQGHTIKKPTILTHTDTFNEKTDNNSNEIGSLISKEKLQKIFEIKLTNKPFQITENLIFLGEIPRNNDFEGNEPIGKVFKNDKFKDDYIVEDSALVYKSNNGLVIITGCSHSGICNIIDYSKNVCNESSIADIVGGFHLVNPSHEKVFRTADYLSKLGVKQIHPCHCTDFSSKIILSKYVKLEATGVGLILKYL